MANIGQVIDGKYEILTMIGQGGMSSVYLARDRRLNKQWAIKEIKKQARDQNNEVVVQSAIAEANLIKQLDHSAIVRIVDIIENEEEIYIIEDYIEGETLGEILERTGAQPQEQVIDWGIQICEALQYLHTRTPAIIYRDMKPANVMLKPDGGGIKVIDFGIAREYKNQKIEDTVCLGTKGYAAPEQFGGKGQTDARTDIYCLGVTLYHLLTGHNPSEPPYEMYPLRYWDPQLSSGLEYIIQKCTQLNPEDRYQSCAELLYALHHYSELDEEYRKKQLQKRNIFFGAVGVMAFGLAVGAFGLFMRSNANNADYSQNIIQAQNASTSEEKSDYYGRAVDIKPLENEAYLGMIEAFKDDASFSIEEEAILKKKINANITELREEDDYGDLAFEVGKLYWYYYDYGKTESSDNQVTRMKSAIQWFEDAATYGGETSPNYLMSTIYKDIGKFNRDINLNIEEASDKGQYAPYWENLNELVSVISASEDESEIIELEVYRLIMYSIETYARKFKADDINQNDMLQLYNTVRTAVTNMDTTTDKTEEIRNNVMARFEATQQAIESAFRE